MVIASMLRSFRPTLRACRAIVSARTRCLSFAPGTFQRHVLDSLRNTGSEDCAMVPLTDVLDDEDCIAAMTGLENVIGIPARDVKRFFDYAPTSYEARHWKNILLTWKDIQKGNDVFLHGLGSFDIMSVYEQEISMRRRSFSRDILNLFKADFLRKAHGKIANARSNSKFSLEKIKHDLSETEDLDLFGLVSLASETDGFKTRGLCDSDPPFPPFIDWSRVHGFQHYRDYFRRRLCKRKLWKCLHSGAEKVPEDANAQGRHQTYHISSRPFWLVPVGAIQPQGHFKAVLQHVGDINSISIAQDLTFVLSQEEDRAQRKHLIEHYGFWNNADNLGFFDEIANIARMEISDPEYLWPEDWESMCPRQLLAFLRDKHTIKGPDFVYHHLESLSDTDGLVVLRSRHQIIDAGYRLGNCAAGYASKVQRKQCVLVLLNDATGKAVALGEHPLRGSWTETGWISILEKHNRVPSKATLDKFYAYSRVLRRWHRFVFVPEMKRQVAARYS